MSFGKVALRIRITSLNLNLAQFQQEKLFRNLLAHDHDRETYLGLTQNEYRFGIIGPKSIILVLTASTKINLIFLKIHHLLPPISSEHVHYAEPHLSGLMLLGFVEFYFSF